MAGMQLTVEVKGNGFNALRNLATDFRVNLAKETAIATKNTAKAHRREISKNVRQYVAMTNKAVLRAVTVEPGNRANTASSIHIAKFERPSLKEFKARQTKKGVSYKIRKGGKRKLVKSAFIGQGSLNGHVYVRVTKSRKPIVKLYGVSVAAVFGQNDLIGLSTEQILARMEVEMQKRIRSIIVRAIRKQGRTEGLSTEQINARIKARFA